MNIALPAIVIFLLALPGFLFRSRLKLAEKTSLDYSPFGRVVSEAVLWAGLLHFIWLSASYVFFERELQVDVLLRFLSPNAFSTPLPTEIGALWVAAYFVTLYSAAYFIPSSVRALITRHRLDRYDAAFGRLFRFHGAPWYYLLSGADFKQDALPDYIQVTAVVEVGKEAFLYTGVLDDYFFGSEGELDRLVLENVSRRPFAKDKTDEAESASRFYAIEGDYFVIRYEDVTTLNIQYRKLEPTTPQPPAASPSLELPQHAAPSETG